MYDKILKAAKNILKNTTSKNSFYLQQDLELFIETFTDMGFDTDFIEFLDVFEYIATDGYDISNFELYEIPHPKVFSFYNHNHHQMFDICIDHFGNNKEKVFASYINDKNQQCFAISIATAIEKYNKFF